MTPNEPHAFRLLVRRFAACAFLFVTLLIAVDAAPRLGPLAIVADAIDPVMDATGLWQGPWNLFAPDVDKINVRVSAVIRFADGAKVDWRSPDWTRLSSWARFASFRHEEYVDSVRLDDSAGAWESLARYLARIVPRPAGAGPVTRVVLTREWAEIPPPGPAAPPAQPYTAFDNRYAFFIWSPPRTP